MNKFKKLTCMMLAMSLAAYPVVCSAEENVAPTADTAFMEDGRTKITVAWPNPTTSLNPFQGENGGFGAFHFELLESLAMYDENYNLYPVIAKSWEQVDEDGYEFDVELFDYVHDSENNPITADDVVFSINKNIELGSNADKLSKMELVEKVDDYTVHIVMAQNGYLDFETVLEAARIVSEEAYEASSDGMSQMMIGTGPYKVTNFVSGSTLVTEKDDNYWQTDDTLRGPYAHANVDVIEKLFIEEASQREVALETNAAAYGVRMPGSSMKQLENNPDIVCVPKEGHHQHCYIPSSRGPLANQQLRQALYYAIDYQALIDSTYDGYAYISGLGLDYSADYNPAWEEDKYTYDPEKAMQLIEESGISNPEITMVIDPTQQVLGEMVQAYLSMVGINVIIEQRELASYLSALADPSSYDLIEVDQYGSSTIGLWGGFLNGNYHNGVTQNGFDDETLQNLILTASSLDGHTPENMDALEKYLYETGYLFTPTKKSVITMWRKDSGIVETVYAMDLNPCLGCCTYTWN